MDIHQQLEASQSRRMAAEDRFLARMEKREALAQPQVGELVRDGKTVYYCWPSHHGAKYFESYSQQAVINRLIRNSYA